MKELFGPAFGPGVEAYGRSFAECLCEDDALVAEVRDRFERSRVEGSFPALGELLSTMADEERKESLFAPMGACSPAPACPAEEPLGPSSVNGNLEAYREDVYSRMTFGLPDLRAFAQEWLEELARVGYHGMEEFPGFPLKQQAGDLCRPQAAAVVRRGIPRARRRHGAGLLAAIGGRPFRARLPNLGGQS